MTPEHTFYDGKAELLVLETPDGLYGIMGGHEPIAVEVIEGEMRFRVDGEIKLAATSAGVATVLQDEVLIMLQTAEWPEEIDINRAKRDKRIAKEKLIQKMSLQEYTLAHSMLARAMARLRVSNRRNLNNN